MTMRLFYLIGILTMIVLTIYQIWGPVSPVEPSTEPTTKELQAEIDRLKPYEAFMNKTNVVITYNGCEDMRKRLGLTP